MAVIRNDPFGNVKAERGERFANPQSVNDFHYRSDKDSSVTAQHHTLGNRPNQAARGDHRHDGENGLQLGTVSSTSSTTAQTTLTAETVVLSLSHEFEADRAYRVHFACRVQMNGGTSPFVAGPKIRRTNASGTIIYEPGGTACITTNFMNVRGWCDLKRTGTSNTTQTIAFTMDKSSTGTPTSFDIENAATAPALLRIEEIGAAGDFSGALEVPTA